MKMPDTVESASALINAKIRNQGRRLSNGWAVREFCNLYEHREFRLEVLNPVIIAGQVAAR